MKAELTRRMLHLVHPFGISRGTSREVEVLWLRLAGEAYGECCRIAYKGQTLEEAEALLPRMAEAASESDLYDVHTALQRARVIAPHHSSARAAFDLALHDLIGKRLGLPVCRYLGLPQAIRKPSSFTIALDKDEVMRRKTEDACSFPILKVKLGRDDPATDIRTLRTVREAAPNAALRVDANAGWSLPTARECVRAAADLGVEFVEQPLAIGNREELEVLRRESPLPLIADEDVQDLASLPALQGKVDGINIKLMKCGGLWEAGRMVAFAQAMGWRIMLGCMIESSIGIAAAAHLAGIADDLDLDAEFLIADNPAGPPAFDTEGRITTPTGPGLGVSPIAGAADPEWD